MELFRACGLGGTVRTDLSGADKRLCSGVSSRQRAPNLCDRTCAIGFIAAVSTLALSVLLAGAPDARAQSLIFIPPLATDTYISPSALSADGSTVVGLSTLVVDSPYHAFRWTAATGSVSLGAVANFADHNFATGASADGAVVTGLGSGSGGTAGLRRTSGGGIGGPR